MTATATSGRTAPRPPPSPLLAGNHLAVLKKWPACATACLILVALHALMLIFDGNVKYISIRPVKVFKRGEWYRIVTNAFFHEGLPHLGLNVMGVWGVGKSLEQKMFGTKRFVILTLWSVLFTSIIYLGGAMLIYKTLDSMDTKGIQHWYKKGTKGFSGILFHWSVISCYADPEALWELDFFDGIKIPSLYYPWASLVLWHLVDPENERGTLMHLAGIIVGLLHVEGYLTLILPAVARKKTTSKDKKGAENEDPSPAASKKREEETLEVRKSVIPDPLSIRDARLKKFH